MTLNANLIAKSIFLLIKFSGGGGFGISSIWALQWDPLELSQTTGSGPKWPPKWPLKTTNFQTHFSPRKRPQFQDFIWKCNCPHKMLNFEYLNAQIRPAVPELWGKVQKTDSGHIKGLESSFFRFLKVQIHQRSPRNPNSSTLGS